MKVLLLSSSDIGGGAARSAYRLHQGLQDINVDTEMLVQSKSSDDFKVIAQNTKLEKGFAKLRPTIDALPLQFYPQRDRTVFSPQWLPSSLVTKVAQACPEVINLHWICNGFLPIDAVRKFKQPLVWTLHDMWAFTGGCHYSYDCNRYLNSCGTCPQLHSKNEWDLSRWTWQRKKKNWQELNPHIVTPSNWLATCARASSLFASSSIEVIPYGLNLEVYKPIEKQFARRLLNLPSNIKLVLFGAMSATSDRRKGFHLLQPALQKLSQTVSQQQWQDQLEIVIMGASQPITPLDLGFKSRYLGKLSDDLALALVYSAADMFVAPSTQDNLANTVLEAIACGLPVVAFDIGGMSDMIEHRLNGYLAKPFDTDDLAMGISWILEDSDRLQKLSHRAREKAEQEFSQELQAKRYLSLFEAILASRSSKS
jgi:glycosyltransferase involved in cell wall biosynthesis